MAVKTTLTAVITGLMLATTGTAYAQVVDPFETGAQSADPFAPRVYGSTQVVRAIPIEVTTPQVTAQTSSNITRVVEPVTQDIQATISAPSVTSYTETGVVKAQHFKQGDLSPEAYQNLLDEADRVRAYQSTDYGYTGISYESAAPVANSYVEPAQNYQIELFAPEAAPAQLYDSAENYSSGSTLTYATTTIVEPAPHALPSHTVRKGDTLYNIAKRYSVTVDDLRAMNGMNDNNIGLGQELVVASSQHSASFISQTIPAATSRPVTLVRNVEPVPGSSSVYAVLPKDTLYSISRRSCVSVGDLISTNGIANPNSLKPGQKLTMPSGHCLN